MFELNIQLQSAFNNTTFFMHLLLAKMAENEIIANRFSANDLRELTIFPNLSSFFGTDHHFCLVNIHSQPF